MTSPSSAAYISSSGTLTPKPIAKRMYQSMSDYATLGYLFWETLITPILSPNSWNSWWTPQPPRNNGARSENRNLPGRGLGRDERSDGGRNGGGRGSGGGGGGFMTMGDLRGTDSTVDSCRATCG